MAICPHCKTNVFVKRIETEPGIFAMRCDCGWIYTPPTKMPSYFELLSENKKLKQRIKELEK